MPSLVASLAWQTRSVDGADGQLDFSVPTDIIVRDKLPVSIARELLTRLDLLSKPCDDIGIVNSALMELRALTIYRSDSEVGVEILASAFAARLRSYPADAVIAACREWPDVSKWWPTWNELVRLVERYSAPRQQICRALGVFLAKSDP